MEQLTRADITDSAIEERRKTLQTCERDIADTEERLQQLQATLEALREKKAALHKDLLWRQLMAEAEAIEENTSDKNHSSTTTSATEGGKSIRQEVAEKIQLAVTEFKRSLQEPADYAAECAADSGGEPVPYCDTDDYADLSALDTVVEDLVDDVKQALTKHAAPVAAGTRRWGSTASSRNASLASRPATHASGASASDPIHAEDSVERAKDAPHAAARRCALLRLLITSLYVGRLEALCGFDAIADPANVPTSDADDIREEVVAAWQDALYEGRELTEEEKREWRAVVSMFLGSPFDAPP